MSEYFSLTLGAATGTAAFLWMLYRIKRIERRKKENQEAQAAAAAAGAAGTGISSTAQYLKQREQERERELVSH